MGKMTNRKHLDILKKGAEIWNRWRGDNPGEDIDLNKANLFRATLRGADLRDCDLSGASLTEIDLSGANLEGADLSDTNLFGANLKGANLSRVNLSHTNLMKADLSGADLYKADLTGANLSRARLFKTNLKKSTLSGANLSGARLKGADFSGAGVTGLKYDRRFMHGRYLGIRGIDSCHGNSIFKRDAQDQDYIDTYKGRNTSFIGKIWFWIWKQFDFGRSIFRVAVFGFLIIIIFSAIYNTIPGLLYCTDKTHLITPFSIMYFSISVFTTHGFGDIMPRNLAGEIIVSTEMILGYITFGLLIAIFANKLARRS